MQSKMKTLFNELNTRASIKLINNARAQNKISRARVLLIQLKNNLSHK